ncbi:AraC family transcriptional regulator [Marinobacterium jannaschii]|uniref:AraC family transcriptional regulator n=1 Tax=Marinobacterium jannaschii TaxID=64970 RepID=UPI00047FAAE9|nr:AraC family transcriptional regulator [Marinobacterium jannaschii]
MQDQTLALYAIKAIEVMESRGVDCSTYIAAAGLHRHDLQDSQQLIPVDGYLKLMDILLADTPVQGLGLIVGQHTSLPEHGVLGYALLGSKTFRQALERLQRYIILYGEMLELELQQEGKEAWIAVRTFKRPFMSDRVTCYLTEELLANLCNIGVDIEIGYQWFTRIELGFRSPGYPELYATELGCPISYNQAETRLFFSAHMLEQPFDCRSERADILCEQQCEMLLNDLQLERGLTSEIHHMLARAPENIPTIDDVARVFNMSVSTLKRRLAEEQMTFRQIVLDFRLGMAKAYLQQSPLSANEISRLLGYSDPPSFYRAFRRKFGFSPQQFRTQN